MFLQPTHSECKLIFTVETTCCWRQAITWIKHTLLNFKKEEKNEKPFTFSWNVGKILGTQPSIKEYILRQNFSSQKMRELF